MCIARECPIKQNKRRHSTTRNILEQLWWKQCLPGRPNLVNRSESQKGCPADYEAQCGWRRPWVSKVQIKKASTLNSGTDSQPLRVTNEKPTMMKLVPDMNVNLGTFKPVTDGKQRDYLQPNEVEVCGQFAP